MKKWPYSFILIATGNQHKLKQFADLMGKEFPVEIKGLSDFQGVPSIVEDQDSFAGNARKKSEVIAEWIGGPVISDDSGLVVPALQGEPGVYSARYAGVNASDEENNEKLRKRIRSIPSHDRNAYYVCAMALAIPGKKTTLVQEECHGMVIEEPRGTEGFGYDPIFYLPEEKSTMAELSDERRYEISHRAKATKEIIRYLKDQYFWGEDRE